MLVKEATGGRLVGNDRLIFYRNGTLFGIGFDPRTHVTRGGPFALVEGVQDISGGHGPEVALADNGTLVFVPGTSAGAPRRTLVWVDRQGHETPIPAPERAYRNPSLSQDGTRIVVTVEGTANTPSTLHVWDTKRPSPILQQISPRGEQRDGYAHWMPDSRTILYKSVDPDGTARVMRINANGAGVPEAVFDLGKVAEDVFPESIAPDGKTLTVRHASGRFDIISTTRNHSGARCSTAPRRSFSAPSPPAARCWPRRTARIRPRRSRERIPMSRPTAGRCRAKSSPA